MRTVRPFVFLALAMLVLPCAAQAGKKGKKAPVDDKHENHFGDATVSSAAATVELQKSHAQLEFARTSARVQNETSDYLFIQKEQVVFGFEFGDFRPHDGKAKKPVIIEPRGKKRMPLKVTGSDQFHDVKAFSVELGGFSLVSAKGSPVEAPDFKLPAAVNSFEAGPFSCALKGKVTQETDLTRAKFACSYGGENIGFIDPSVVALKIESGQEFASTNTNAKRQLLQPGGKATIVVSYVVERRVVDMQFATMHLVWREAFSESERLPVEVGRAELSFDPAKTAEHND